jgi:hypothetical protein
MPISASRRLPFTTGQLAILIVFGWIFWFVGALICRVVGEMGWFDSTFPEPFPSCCWHAA